MKKVFIIIANMVDPVFGSAPKANLYLVKYRDKPAEFHPNDRFALEFDTKGIAEKYLQTFPGIMETVYYEIAEVYKKIAS